ncbi:MAG: hypothetical protein AAF645_03755 [Myxococcota bacterium]
MQRRFALALLLLAACGGSDGDPCNAVLRALASASPGSVVDGESCRFEGPLTVPAGVRLTSATVVGSGDVVTLLGDAALESVDVESSGGRAVVADGAHMLTDVAVRITSGVGVSASGAGTWMNVRVSGALDPLRPDVLPPLAGTDLGQYLVAIDGGEIEAAGLSINRGGPWGVIVANGRLVMNGGVIEDIVGIGVYATESVLDLRDVTVRNMIQGLQPFPAHAIASVNTDVALTGTELTGGDGLGLRLDGGTGTLSASTVESQRLGGVWLQAGAQLDGSSVMFMDNGLAALTARAGSRIGLEDSDVLGTTFASVRSGDQVIEVGDGLQADVDAALALTRVNFVNNARVGLVIESSAATNLSFSDVRIEGGTLGAILQAEGVVDMSDWRTGIERTAALVDADTRLEAALPLADDLALLPATGLE